MVMAPPDDLDGLSHTELKGLVVKQWEQIVELQDLNPLCTVLETGRLPLS